MREWRAAAVYIRWSTMRRRMKTVEAHPGRACVGPARSIMQRRLIVLSFLVVLGCKRSEAPSNRPAGNGDPVVATFADHRVTASEFQRYFNDQSPFVRSHYGSAEGRKSVLEVMIQTELLADQALKEGFDVDD